MHPIGLPEITSTHPLIEQMGQLCRLSPTLSVWRRCEMDPGRPFITFGDEVVIFDYVRLVVSNREEWPDAGITLGNRVMINCGSFLSGEGGLIIEDEVLIGPHVKILSAGHQLDDGHPSIYRNKITYAPTHIGEGAWLGAGATITQGCRIGKGVVVAAGAVVTHDAPDFAIVTGIPASIQRFRRIQP